MTLRSVHFATIPAEAPRSIPARARARDPRLKARAARAKRSPSRAGVRDPREIAPSFSSAKTANACRPSDREDGRRGGRGGVGGSAIHNPSELTPLPPTHRRRRKHDTRAPVKKDRRMRADARGRAGARARTGLERNAPTGARDIMQIKYSWLSGLAIETGFIFRDE